jgi:hypothetical protein
VSAVRPQGGRPPIAGLTHKRRGGKGVNARNYIRSRHPVLGIAGVMELHNFTGRTYLGLFLPKKAEIAS